MSKSKKNKSELLSKEEIKREEFINLEYKDEPKGKVAQIINKYLMDALAISIVNHMFHEECYEFDEYYADSLNYSRYSNNEPFDEDKLVFSTGEFNPLDYSDIYDFINTSANDYDVISNWNKKSYRKITIEPLILEEVEEKFLSNKDELIDELSSFGKTIVPDLMDLIKNTVVTYKEIRKSKANGSIINTTSTKTFKEKLDEISDDYLDTVELEEILENSLDYLDEDFLSEYLSQEFIEDVNNTEFKDIYLRGCSLLAYEDNFYKEILYSNSENQAFFYSILKNSVDIDIMLDSSGAIAKIKSKGIWNPRNKFDEKGFAENYVIDNDRNSITDAKKYIRDKVLSKKTELKDYEEYLKLLAAIYSYEIGEYSSVRLKEVFQYENLRNMLLTTDIKEIIFDLYPKYKTQDSIKRVLPREPKDYYPNARKFKRKFILHIGPTNSGKTHESLEAFKKAESGVYLAPLRLLALEVQEKMNSEGCITNLLTGEEEEIFKESKHVCCTIEKLNFLEVYKIAIIDECQLIEDSQRGSAWTAAILGVCAEEVHVCMASYAEDIVKELIDYCGDTYEIINHFRDTELVVEKKGFNIKTELQKGDAIVAFSKRKVLNIAAIINTKTNMKCSVLFGALPYKSRKKQFQNFSEGMSDVLVTTDCIGMGVNLAVKRVIFKEDSKFDGSSLRKLKTSEILQIAGRAGRKNIYDEGIVIIPNKNMLNEYNKEIPSLNKVYIGLTHHICDVDGHLEDIISAWEQIDFKLPFIKADIRNQKKILNSISNIHLSKENQYKAIFLPVNPESHYEMSLLEEYLSRVSGNKDSINFPTPPPLEYDDKLKQLEGYSKAIDLYYSVCKVYGLNLDIDMVNRERENTCNSINRLLLSDKLEIPRCNCCGKELAWDYSRYRCESCYSGYGHNRYYGGYDWDDDDDWDDDF